MSMHVAFELKGKRDCLHHRDDVELADELTVWRKDPANKNVSKKGDDRSPPWTWQTYLYHDGTHLACPFENLMASLLQGGARLILKGNTSYKELTQAGIVLDSEFFPFFVSGKQIALEEIYKLHDLPFAEQAARAKKLGFKLFVKRAGVGQAKHVRVRARFSNWSITGSFAVDDPALALPVLRQIWDLAGNRGLFDWRPGSPKKPGPFGVYDAKLKEI